MFLNHTDNHLTYHIWQVLSGQDGIIHQTHDKTYQSFWSQKFQKIVNVQLSI